MKTTELKNKTVFDFTQDKALLKQITGQEVSEQEYRETVAPICAAQDLMKLGRMMKDSELYDAAEKLSEELDKSLGSSENGLLLD